MRVLAVDDDAMALMAMSAMVTALGHECLRAGNGQEAWDLIMTESLDVVITDREMPDLDGLELCRKIREMGGSSYLYVVLASGFSQDEQARDGMLAGADDYLAKPLKLRQLERKLIAAERVTTLHRQLAEVDDDLRRSRRALASLNDDLEQRVRHRTSELEASNRELDAFAYSVAHDLRAPLRSLHGYSQLILEGSAGQLGPGGMNYLRRIQANTSKMSGLIDDLLRLAQTSRAELSRETVDLTAMAQEILAELALAEPGRTVHATVSPALTASGDLRLIQLMLRQLLANAWKFTGQRAEGRIEFSVRQGAGQPVFMVRDNGSGFDPRYADKLFTPFQRLHAPTEFAGSGIGLTIAERVIRRHGGRLSAASAPDEGARFFFTLASDDDPREGQRLDAD